MFGIVSLSVLCGLFVEGNLTPISLELRGEWGSVLAYLQCYWGGGGSDPLNESTDVSDCRCGRECRMWTSGFAEPNRQSLAQAWE